MSNTENYEVITSDNELTLSNDHLLQMAREAEDRFNAINTIMKLVLRVTTHLDWVNIGNKPYLQETGASKIATALGISVEVLGDKKVYDEDRSGHYSYHYDMKFTFASITRDATGMRSTNDEFFIGKKDATMKNPDGSIVPKPQKKPQDVNERDVKLAAYTNCLNNGIKRIVPGLRNITLEHLAEGGIDTSKMKGYGFNNNQGTSMSNTALDQKADIERMLKEVYGTQWTKGLEKATEFTATDGKVVAGKTDINKVTEKQMSFVYKSVKGNYDKWVKDGAKPLHNDAPAPATESSSDTLPEVVDNDLISPAQAKRIYAIAKGDSEIINSVLMEHDYASTKDIRKSDYEAICSAVEALATGDQ